MDVGDKIQYRQKTRGLVLENFKSFITEAKEEKYKVVVLTRKPKDNPDQNLLVTASKFQKSAKSLEMESYVVLQLSQSDMFQPC